MSYKDENIITFSDAIDYVREQFTHDMGMAIAAMQAGNTQDAAQWIAAGALEFENALSFAQNVYNDTADRMLCSQRAIIVDLDPWIVGDAA